jgi:hypothetical protein
LEWRVLKHCAQRAVGTQRCTRRLGKACRRDEMSRSCDDGTVRYTAHVSMVPVAG